MTNIQSDNNRLLSPLKPQPLWDIFESICQIPRPSKHEEQIIKWVLDFAKHYRLEALKDKAGNIIIRKPATAGYENRKGVILQCHLDMVPQKNNSTYHDFTKDPIKPRIIDGWVYATDTTLGADNGIGVAAALAVLSSTEIKHGPLECLFTFDEETGMTGAIELQPNLLQGDILLNLDSEDYGELFIGCAGGIDTVAKIDFNKEVTPSSMTGLKVHLKGLKGGHSGIDIHKGRGNSNKILNRFLWLAQKSFDFRLSEINGGTLRNAIPREAYAIIAIKSEHKNAFVDFAQQYLSTLKNELVNTDPQVSLTTEAIDLPTHVIDIVTQSKFINAVYACVNGVFKMSTDMPGLVETSSNLAIIKMKDNSLYIESLQRSSVDSQKDDVKDAVASCFLMIGAEVTHNGSYPGWQPNPKSEILEVTKKVFKDLTGTDCKVMGIHAGLECGLLGKIYPHWDMISFGPTIKGAHSPDERVDIQSVEKFWIYFLEVLKNIPAK